LAATPDGRYLVAGSYDDRAPGSAIAKPKDMSEDEHAAHHKAPANKKGSDEATVSTVSVIKSSDKSIVRAIEVPGAVHHVSISPDGRYAVVTRPNEDAISVIDLESYQVVANPNTGSLPNYTAFSPDSTRLYVSNAADNTIAMIEVGHWASRTLIAVGKSPEHVVLSGDGKTLYANNVEDGTVSVVDTNSLVTTKVIPIGSTVHGIDISDDGTRLFVASLGDDKMVQIDLATGAKKDLELNPEPYHLAAISGSGKLYISSADKPKIWVVDQKTLGVLGEITIGGKGHQMVIMPGS